ELINTRNGFHLWTETYDRELAGVFALQDEITRSIVDALRVKLAASLRAQQQSNTEVYDLYLQGLYFSNKASEEDLRRALSFFQRAVEKDPTFARAWTGIAKVWYFLRSEEHTSELQSRGHLVCRLLLEKKKKTKKNSIR